YPRPDEILMLFQDRFPLGSEKTTGNSNQCRALTEENRGFLGDNRPGDGKPLVAEPNLHFVKWYTGCLAVAVGNELQALSSLQTQALPGTMDPSVLAWIPAPEDSVLKEEYLGFFQAPAANKPSPSVTSMSSTLKKYLTAQVISRLIGPDLVIGEKPPFFSADAVRARVQKNIEATDFSADGFQSMGFEKLLAGKESTIFGYLAVTMLITGLQDEFLIQ
ncbi:MAG: hypothetical protein K2X47_16440, partial [Bdellovibrionales bacterium]|nr:hypothetical protein [Bdellovibrionales bacterium]